LIRQILIFHLSRDTAVLATHDADEQEDEDPDEDPDSDRDHSRDDSDDERDDVWESWSMYHGTGKSFTRPFTFIE
jgi:hypothetical protein